MDAEALLDLVGEALIEESKNDPDVRSDLAGIEGNLEVGQVVVGRSDDGPGRIDAGLLEDAFAPDVLYGAGDHPESVAVGDLDGDSDLDLAVANSNGGNVSVLLNNGDGTFADDVLYGVGDGPLFLPAGDLR